MFDPSNGMLPPPSSPTISSLSSSDLDTESTGSFFQDRSTTLGTLMGVSVTLQPITFRASSQRRPPENPVSAAKGGRRNKKRRAAAARERRRWWRLCRDEDGSGRASLGEYLEVERRFGDGGAAVEIEEGIVQEVPRNGRALFADGRVLPPAEVVEESPPVAAGICRFAAVERWCSGLVL